jgi:MFS family permease
MRERLSVLRHPDFRRLWLAQAGSVLGDRIVLIATALYVTELTGSATDLGIVLAAQALPLVGFLLVGGVWADRLPRARLMLVSDIVRAALQGSVALLIALDATRVWQLVVIGLLFGVAEAFARPAYTGLVPETVPEAEIQQARALISMSENAAELLGPAIGTGLVLGLGAGAAFGIDAATFLISAWLLLGVGTRDRSRDRAVRTAGPSERQPSPAHARDAAPSWRRELGAGFAEVRKRVWVWATIAGATIALLLSLAPLFVLGPSVADDVYGSTAFYGIVLSAFGAGAIGGALAGLRWRPARPLLIAHVLCLIWPLIGVLMALGAPRGLVLAAAAAGGFGVALFDVWWNTALAEQIPPDALSRVSSFDWMGSLALLPIGYALTGPLADAVGAREVLVAGGLLTLCTTSAAALPRATRTLGFAPLTSRSRPPATP